MRRLVFRNDARIDLGDIVQYLAHRSGSSVVASRFVEDIRRHCARLAALPGTLGRARPELGAGCRSVAHRGYVIVFRYDPGALRVLSIYEGHRDVPAKARDLA